MFVAVSASHHRPHFHAYYQDQVVVIAIDNIDLIAGQFPQKQLRLVVAWAELHQEELLEVWENLQSGRPPFKIDPLR